MNELLTALLVYGASIVILQACALLFWALNYWDGSMSNAASCLRFIPRAPVWPYLAVRAVVRAMGETLETDWL